MAHSLAGGGRSDVAWGFWKGWMTHRAAAAAASCRRRERLAKALLRNERLSLRALGDANKACGKCSGLQQCGERPLAPCLPAHASAHVAAGEGGTKASPRSVGGGVGRWRSPRKLCGGGGGGGAAGLHPEMGCTVPVSQSTQQKASKHKEAAFLSNFTS
jgi:hypothetical protein